MARRHLRDWDEEVLAARLKQRARQRALTRLRALHLDDYKRLYEEEARVRGVRVGRIGRPRNEERDG